MLACIACAKHDPADGGEDGDGTHPSDKEAVKSLSSQVIPSSFTVDAEVYNMQLNRTN